MEGFGFGAIGSGVFFKAGHGGWVHAKNACPIFISGRLRAQVMDAYQGTTSHLICATSSDYHLRDAACKR